MAGLVSYASLNCNNFTVFKSCNVMAIHINGTRAPTSTNVVLCVVTKVFTLLFWTADEIRAANFAVYAPGLKPDLLFVTECASVDIALIDIRVFSERLDRCADFSESLWITYNYWEEENEVLHVLTILWFEVY